MADSFVRDRLPPPELLPEFRFDLPEVQYPERLNAAAELLKGGSPEDLSVVNDHGRWTYAELDDFSGRIARFLVEEQELIPGKRVLLRGPNGYTMFAAWLGVLKAGGAQGIGCARFGALRPTPATVLWRSLVAAVGVVLPGILSGVLPGKQRRSRGSAGCWHRPGDGITSQQSECLEEEARP